MQRSSFTRYVKSALARSGAIAVARRSNSQVLRILGYHAVADSPDYCIPEINVRPAEFERQLQFLRLHYQVISLDQALGCFAADEPLPERAVTITFDDGYRDNYIHAFPLLRKYGLTATFFVASGIFHGIPFWVAQLQRILSQPRGLNRLAPAFEIPAHLLRPGRATRQALISHVMGYINRCPTRAARDAMLDQVFTLVDASKAERDSRSYMLEAAHIREMAAAGMTIGSHTVTHAVLTSLEELGALDELVTSKQQLEAIIEQPVRHFAHPNGPGVINYSETTARLAHVAGFASACTSIRGMAQKSSNRFLLPRHNVNDDLHCSAFAFKLEEHRFPLLLMGT